MKNSILVILSGLAFSVGGYAAGPGVVTVKGSIIRQSNPQGHCGASTFGYVVEGTFKDKDGKDQAITGCLEAISIPLGGTVDAGLSNNLLKDSMSVLKKASGKAAIMTFAVEDMDDIDYSAGTLLSIELDKTSK